MSKKNTPSIPPIETDPACGLTAAEVAARTGAHANRVRAKSGKSYFRIITDNLLTFFNLIWAIIIGVLIAVGAYDKLLFSAVILANTLIAIIQESRAKRTVEKLSMVTAPRARVVRDGEESEIAAERVVRDDILLFTAGNQIPCDCVVVDGRAELNESLLTGESDGVKKAEGDTLLAGSFVISGACRARAVKVGDEAYIQQVARRAKAFKAPHSYLFRDINRIIRIIGFFILPFSVVMYFNNYSVLGDAREAILKTTGAVEGMIPAGMFLLITVALSLGVVRLAARRTSVKDSYSVEMLARTNMLCLDKTGTITDGTMRVAEEQTLSSPCALSTAALLATVVRAQPDSNFTSDALRAHYTEPADVPVGYVMPFSSKRKCSATVLSGIGTFALGAPEFLHIGEMPEALLATVNGQAAEGRRVLMLAYSPEEISEDALPERMTPVALVMLEDHIRPEAYDTLRWFRENDVGVKIISGDNPITVASIARRVGVEGAEHYCSLEGKTPEEAAALADEYTVFGRVTPEQKHALVVALKKKGYVVSMTGDGVNDTMALKEADCSIAMADGSEAARGLSNIVLLDNNFASLPAVVREGRQVVNNVTTSSTLFLMKTFFAITLSLFCVITGTAYPFDTSGMLLFELFIDGLPSVILALQPNDKIIEGRFIREVLKKCIPSGLTLLLSVVAVVLLNRIDGFFAISQSGNPHEYWTTCVLALAASGFAALLYLCLPFTKLRAGCVAFAFCGVALCVGLAPVIPGLGGLCGVYLHSGRVFLITAIVFAVALGLVFGLDRLFRLIGKRRTALCKDKRQNLDS